MGGRIAACDVIALVARHPLCLYAPIALMVGLAVISRRVARAHLARLLDLPVAQIPAEWTST